MYREIIHQLKNLSVPNEGYSFSKINDSYWGYDSNGCVSFGVESKSNDTIPLLQSTKYLNLSYNVEYELLIDNRHEFKKMHIVSLNDMNKQRIETFIYLTLSFEKQVDDSKFLKYFSNLKILFSNNKKNSDMEMQGFFGELFTILYFKKNLDVDLSKYYQSIEKLKFDFSVDEKRKIEIKTTLKPNRVHHFRLEQLNTEKYDIYIISILMQKDDKGLSLYDLIEKCKIDFSDNYLFLIYIEKFISNWRIEELMEIKFSEIKANETLACFHANKIPKIYEKTVEGIFNVEFDSDLTNISQNSNSEILNWLINNDS